MSSIGRSRSRSSSVANNTARALALLPEPLPAQQHQQLLCLQDTLQTIPAMPNKSAKYDPVEWPDVLSRGNDEQDRMVAQHYILRTAFGGDFSAPARSMLEKGCVVLDVGCGPGTWTMEMSTEFPNSSFIGIDCLNAFPRDIKPKNCHFRTCTVGQQSSTTLASLPFPDNSIDYIFQRDLNLGLQAHMWSPLVKEYLRILKPGGWVELMEPDMETQSSLRNECAMNDKLLYGLSLRQQDPYVGRRLPSILAVNGFRRVESEFQSLPLGWGSSHASPLSSPTQPTHPNASESNPRNPSLPVDLSPPCSEFARAVSSHYLFTLQSLQPWLSAVINISPEKYAATISNLPAEWKQARTYINWHCAVAQKPRTEEPF
ncbi:S-adenosyl-L-methionine-dependent methyltransferase [Phycomyces blakesleeanus]